MAPFCKGIILDALAKLNTEQYAAATAPSGHNLIIASAGTGKTSTIVARIAHLLNLGTSPRKILLLTFTNKAASEMIARLQRHFDKKITSAIVAGTFHAVSYAQLRELGKGVILKQPAELKTLLKSLVERRKFYHVSDARPYGGAYLYDVYSLYQNKEMSADFETWFSKNYEDQAEFAEIYADILREFEEEKAKFNYADFNDVLLKMRHELRKGAPLRFDEILVDEYQDTNSLQGSLIDAFATKSLFCVGDFDQSIYAFNGANIDIIGSFGKRFADAKIYALNINYRSSSAILALANRVIANNPRLYEKKLIVGREGKFSAPRLHVYDDTAAQYAHVAAQIAQSSTPREKIAVIFRNNSSADGVEVALKELGIGAKRKGGVSFFESREIKAFTDIFAMIINPKDMMAFMSTCEYARGVGSALSKELFDALIALGYGSIHAGLLRPDESVKIFEKKRKNYQLGLFDDVDIIGSVSRFEALEFDEFFRSHPVLKHNKITEGGAVFLHEIYKIFKKSGSATRSATLISQIKDSRLFALVADFIATKRATLKNGKIDEDRKKDETARIYDKCGILEQIAGKYADPQSFYNFITLGAKEMSEGEGVNLLSVHASKGLEFCSVYLIDLAQNRFPNLKLMAMGGSLEEERRLFYVAVTRARDELVLSYAKFDKIRKVSYEPSCFLREAGLVK
ncbi:ATP-dependent helicase [uncultured Campylobacter sp.]|uniref:ATP-dependent helicase n=1 Tax=uncultured Campylobacter sp. TaxID=218934 RepID=UPI002626D72B|nr:ATP-dependent helicase [uncultured Campylobacter sp.]